MNINAAQQFTATVTNSTNTAVTWTVQESAAGTITTAGNYTAPAVPGTYHVVAISQADATKSATAAVTVQATTPTISSVPVTTGTEGVAYTYDPAATDPGGTAITLTMTASPTGATFDGQHVAWTPTNEQSRMANDFSIKATTAAGGVKTQSWTVTPVGSVNFKEVSHYLTESGVADVVTTPADTAIVQQNGNVFTTYNPVAQVGGTLKFGSIPAGSYWIVTNYGQTYQQQSANSVVNSLSFVGRPDINTFGSPLVTYTLAGLNDVQGTDNLQVISLGAAVSYRMPLALPLGSTSGTFSATWNDFMGGLPDAAKGDKIIVCQRQTQNPGPRGFPAIVACSPSAAITIPDQTATISATLGSVPLTTTRLHVSGDTFEALVPGIGSSVTTLSSDFLVQLQPTETDLFALAPIVAGFTGVAPIITNEDVGNVTFGNPLTGWVPQYIYRHNVRRSYTAPGATTSRAFNASLVVRTNIGPTAASPLAATLGPVTAAKINGLDLTADQTGVGLTPTISWTAPTKGTPKSYEVEILSVTGSSSIFNYVKNFVTTASSVTIPSGVLQSGKAYVIAIYADDLVPGVSTSSASAPMLSGLITP